MIHRILTIGAGLFLLLLFGCEKFEEPDVKGDADIKIKASEICRVYSKDKQRGNRQFKGKVLEVTGEVVSKNYEFAALSNVKIKSGGAYPVKCFFSNKHNEKIKKVAKGKKVTIKGICRGRTSKYIKLTGCVIVQEKKKKKRY